MTNDIYMHLSSASFDYEFFKSGSRAYSYLTLGWFDINSPIESETERSILHFAAKNDDLELMEWAISHGADPNVTDKKGKKPADVCKSQLIYFSYC
jgi:hypothetical protein